MVIEMIYTELMAVTANSCYLMYLFPVNCVEIIRSVQSWRYSDAQLGEEIPSELITIL